MENKLELKEVAAYLPYKVCLKSNEGRPISILTGLNYPYIECTLEHNIFNHVSNFSLVLFSLDFLTKEIEVNGEKFVPIDTIYNIWNEKGLSAFSKSILKKKIFLYSESMPYWLVQKLLEWKFDIFGLIEKGLAIAVTDEFNPYK